MNPTDFFNKKNGFPFNAIPETQFNPEHIHDLKQMIKQYHSVLNDDFWGDIHGLRTSKRKGIEIIPIEIWEDEENLYLIIVAPGLQNKSHAKIYFHNDQALTLKIKTHSLKPVQSTQLITSDLPQNYYEREIFLKKSVLTSSYSSSYEKGVLTYTFNKVNDELEIPFDF
ncbi:HSP20 family molecular chaperone IbpA [Salirhabdus euzebyi]|uniref:HSP20 family molecular chaperone IbpA n=1 Tax=Salirhabdus euzebyi TaxID=394506 RepID=A0A841Q6T5_9BACI|nr:hypothetical protein [Salirhabdus euzebyi]MBB6454012.1 HSP20 family molecular chaperone IbpA [Salirhabdus euzebyi]